MIHVKSGLVITALIIIALLPGCGKKKKLTVSTGAPSLVEVVKNGGSTLFSIPFEAYALEGHSLPIGVFDSGIGGLTVLSEILLIDRFDNATHKPGPDGRPDFENERFVYLGDQANMPYGNYPAAGKIDFLKELIIKDTVFLLGSRYCLSADEPSPRNDKPPVKAIVIACNTATAYGLEDVRAALETWGIPIYLVGVVEAGARGAIEALDGKAGGDVAVMATVGTCQSEGYPNAIGRVAREKGIAVPDVIQQGSLGLAGAIEGDESFITGAGTASRTNYRGPSLTNTAAPIDTMMAERYAFEKEGLIGDSNNPASWQLNSIENYIRYDTATLLENQRKKSGKPITAVILGCTHFPFHKDRIAAAFRRLKEYKAPDGSHPYESAVADSVLFIDPSLITAEALYEALAERGQLIGSDEKSVIETDEFYISIPNPKAAGVVLSPNGGFDYNYKYGRTPGDFTIEYVLRVPMSALNISENVAKSIRTTMPEVWKRMVAFNRSSPRTAGLPTSARLE